MREGTSERARERAGEREREICMKIKLACSRAEQLIYFYPGQKIRQIQFLRSTRNSFLQNVDPLANEERLLQILVSRNVLKSYNVERLKQVHLGKEKRAEKFWQLLVRVPHHSFFAAVEPLLTKHYASIFKADSSAAGDQRQRMCFRDVAEVVLPLKEMAENLKEFLKDSDYE